MAAAEDGLDIGLGIQAREVDQLQRREDVARTGCRGRERDLGALLDERDRVLALGPEGVAGFGLLDFGKGALCYQRDFAGGDYEDGLNVAPGAADLLLKCLSGLHENGLLFLRVL